MTARAQANAISPDAVLELTGTIQAQAYAPTTFPQGAACAETTAIDSVFVLVLTAAGQTLQVPMYASRTGGTRDGVRAGEADRVPPFTLRARRSRAG